MHYRSGGSMGMMKFVTNYFFEQFGPATVKSGNVCSGAGDQAQLEDFGDKDNHDIFDILQSKTIVIWGKNVYVSSVYLLPILKKARRRGARLILIDPVYHRTANLCEYYLQPHPGGDTAIALGVAQILFETNSFDHHAELYCDHLDQFRALAYSRSIEQWAELAGLRTEQIETLARLYSDGPSAILVGWGMQRKAWGASTIRTLDTLGAISGNIGIPGGGVSFSSRWPIRFNMSFLKGLSAAPRTIPEPLLGRGILQASAPPIRMV